MAKLGAVLSWGLWFLAAFWVALAAFVFLRDGRAALAGSMALLAAFCLIVRRKVQLSV